MKTVIQTFGITLTGALMLATGTLFATSDPTEKIQQIEADCLAKAEEMKAANMPDAEQILEECLAEIEEMQAEKMKPAVEAMPDKVDPKAKPAN